MPTLTPYYMGIVLKFLYIYKKNIIKLQILNQLHYSLLLTFTVGLVQHLYIRTWCIYVIKKHS